jgi:hypothetical protein
LGIAPALGRATPRLADDQKKMRPKAGGIYRIGREAYATAPEGGRDPWDDAAKVALLKSTTLKTLV